MVVLRRNPGYRPQRHHTVIVAYHFERLILSWMNDLGANRFKVIVVGASGVGKTAIVNQLANHTFKEESQPTIGVEFKSWSLQTDSETLKLQIWDTAGQERFRSVSKAYFRNALGAVLVFDLTIKASFEELNTWINDLNILCAPNAYIILVGNKTDLAEDRVVTEVEGAETAKRYGIEYLETSAKSGDHIADAFVRLGAGILRQIKVGRITAQKLGNENVDPSEKAAEQKKPRDCMC
jgi:small GTP-binding protein